jgi:hypothetical protein
MLEAFGSGEFEELVYDEFFGCISFPFSSHDQCISIKRRLAGSLRSKRAADQ